MLHLNFYQIRTWLRQYWFQAAIASLFLFLLLRRDMSFQISFKQPTDAAVAATTAPTQVAIASVQHNGYSDNLSASTKQHFIDRFLSIAQQERAKYGVPTSIILAQGILQTQAGTNPLAQKGNNFFKLKAGGSWKGGAYKAKTGVYRAYTSAWASFRDFSEYVTTGDYASLKQLNSTDYKAWAAGLERVGYGNQADLAQTLVAIIENNNLQQYDK